MKLAIGSANLGAKYGLFGQKKFEKKNFFKVEKILLNSNFKYIDTAHEYKGSEKVIGNTRLKRLKIVTKILLPSKKLKDIEEFINKIIKASLRRLKKKELDTVLIHNSDDLFGKNGKKFLKALSNLKKKKIVKNIGVSIYDDKQLMKVWKIWKPDVVQAPLNIFDQRIIKSGWMKKLKRNQVKLFVRSCFLQGMLTEEYKDLDIPEELFAHLNKFKKWCELNKISRVKACIDFVKQFKDVYCLILGFNDLNQLKDITNQLKKKNKKITKKFAINNTNYIDPRKWKQKVIK